MNYAGKFDGAISLDSQGSNPTTYVHVDSFTAKAHGHVPAGAFAVPDPNLIFNGEFKRAGLDLVLSHDGHDFVVHDYFRGDKRAAIASPDGAFLTGDVVNALTGHVQYAQAAPGAAAAQVIGHVTKLSGSATAIRNGVSVILNNGDNVEKGDVVSTGADSTLGITFIDGTVFGLSSNARMVLNEMVYDPNGSNNSSLLSLVAGTITFVAGETAKHGDMKVDTPVATMGIRGTAVLTQINFVVPAGGGDAQPQASFQVLVEPDGTTGSYILFDRVTLLPIATVNQAGQMIQISGGNVSVSSALLSPDVQKLITDVFTLKFTGNDSNTKLTTNFTDTITQTSAGIVIKTPAGFMATAVFANLNPQESLAPALVPPTSNRIPGPPQAQSLDLSGNVTTAFSLTERAGVTGDAKDSDTVSGVITFVDQNLGDRPTVSVNLAAAPNFVYKNASQQDVTASLTALQKQDIAATQINISVVAAGGNNNNGSAVWTYTIPDHVFDFLAAGETLTLTYMVRVDDNFSLSPDTTYIPITITITGTNDKPVITTSVPTITFEGGTSVSGGPLISDDPTSGTLTFNDVDLTDTHEVEVSHFSAVLPGGTVPEKIYNFLSQALKVSIEAGDDSTGSGTGTITWSLQPIKAYLADFIPEGKVLTLTYTVTVTDSQGATSNQTITVTITGTDAAAVVWIATDDDGLPSGGFWKDGDNWETGIVPTIDDDVIVITDQLHGLTPAYPVTIDAAAYAKSLTMNDFGGPQPELINQSSLTIAGALNMNAGSILINAGTMSVGGKAEILDTSVLTNEGDLTLAGGGDFAVGAKITNSGTIELSGGTLKTLAEIHNTDGTLKVDAGTTLIVDTATVDGGTVTILGTLELDGASVIENGTLKNSSAVNVNGTVEFANEAVSNTSSGTIKVLANGWLTVDQDSSVTNHGTVTIDASGKLTVNGATIDGGTLTVSGTLESTGATTITDANISNSHLIEAIGGVLALVATTSATAISNGGTIQANGGELDINGEAVTNTGMLAAINDGTLKLTAMTVTNTGGTITVDGASKFYLTDVSINGGSLSNAGNLYSVSGLSGVNTITGNVTNTGTIEVESGTLNLSGGLTGAGTLIIDDKATLELGGDVSGAVGLNVVAHGDVTITNNGHITGTTCAIFETGGAVTINNSGDINGNISVATATFNNEVGGTWTVSGTSVFGTLSTIDNAGTIDLRDGASISSADGETFGITNSGGIESWGTATITGAITNTGTIEVHDGELTLFGSLSGSGSVTIDAGATLKLVGTVSQTITFGGDGAELQIQTCSFGGSIAGFAVSDKIDLSTIRYDYRTTAIYSPTTGDLVVSDAYGHTITIKLDGDYSGLDFVPSNDGSCHTLITLTDATGKNAAPTLDNATLPSVAGNTTDPSGSTLNDLFANKFHDVDAGASLKAIAVTSDAASAAQGVWQYELAGTHQWVNIGSVGDTHALVLSPDTLIRFVPAPGYSGTPGALGVHALDDTYTGAITTAGETATINLTATGTGGSTPVSHDLTTIGTDVTAPPATGPVIDTTHFQVVHFGKSSAEIITNLHVIDTDPGAATDTFTVTMSTSHPFHSNILFYPTTGSLHDIDTALGNGVFYNPGHKPPATDGITLTVTDKTTGLFDTVHFIFNEAGNTSHGITLTGTSGKDVIFAADTNDTLTGGGGMDQFVFAPVALRGEHPATNFTHTITDFTEGLDKIDLRLFSDIGSMSNLVITQQSGDTLVTWQQHVSQHEGPPVTEHESLLLKSVTASLHASDFIFHA